MQISKRPTEGFRELPTGMSLEKERTKPTWDLPVKKETLATVEPLDSRSWRPGPARCG